MILLKTVLDCTYLPQSFPLYVLHSVHVRHPTTLVMHSHDFAELTAVTSGRAVHQVLLPDGTQFSYPIRAGHVFLINKGEAHTFLLEDEPLVVENILFDPAILRLLPQQLSGILPGKSRFFTPSLPYSQRYPLQPIEEPYQLRRLDSILHELVRETSALPESSAACLLLLLLYTNAITVALDRQTVSGGRYSGPIHILQLIDRLQQHCSESLSLEALAAETGYSVRSLTAQFRACTGETILGFLQRVRIEKACFYLDCTDMCVTDIALSTGFNNLSYFNKLFKRQTGQTPSQYRGRQSIMESVQRKTL